MFKRHVVIVTFVTISICIALKYASKDRAVEDVSGAEYRAYATATDDVLEMAHAALTM